MPGFHHSIAVLPLPFCRSTVVKSRCSVKNYVRKFRSVTAVYAMQRQRQRQRCTETATAKGNGETATEERQRNGGNRALSFSVSRINEVTVRS